MSINPIASGGALSTSSMIGYWRGRIEGALAEGRSAYVVPWIGFEHYFSDTSGNQFVLMESKDYDLSEGGPGWQDLYGALWQLMFVADRAAHVGHEAIFPSVRGSAAGGPFSPDEGVKVLCGLLELGMDVVKETLQDDNDLKQKALANMSLTMSFLRYIFGQIIDVS